MTEHELPWYEVGEIYEYFGYKNRRAALRAVRLGKFPCKTYILAGRKPVINKSVLKDFFQLDD